MSNQSPKISVILPIYNVEQYLGLSLDSIINQTLQEIEIICIDDGSLDHSLKILEDYAKKDSRIIIKSQTNAGAGAARNTGLRLAKGQYLSFLDADDFFEPTMLQQAYDACEKDSLDFVVFRSDSYENENGRFIPADWTIKTNLLPQKTVFNLYDIDHDRFKVFNGWAWDKLYRKDFVLDNQLYFQEQRTTNDLLFVFSALLCAKRISILNDVLAHHRKNISDSLSVTREKSWNCFYHALLALRAKLIELSLYKKLEQDYINYALHFSLWNINTLTAGESLEKLFHALKQTYWPELKLDQFPKEYFYHEGEYRQYRQIMDKNFEEFIKRNQLHKTNEKSASANMSRPQNIIGKLYFFIKRNGIVFTLKKIKQILFTKK